jgi:hypothetical protein
MRSLESASFATELANPSVPDAVIWIAEATEKLSPQTVQRCLQKAVFSANDLNEEEANQSSVHEPQKSVRLHKKILWQKITLTLIM